jgi:hypothetical protein
VYKNRNVIFPADVNQSITNPIKVNVIARLTGDSPVEFPMPGFLGWEFHGRGFFT